MGRSANRTWQRRIRRYLAERKTSERLRLWGLFGHDKRFATALLDFARLPRI